MEKNFDFENFCNELEEMAGGEIIKQRIYKAVLKTFFNALEKDSNFIDNYYLLPKEFQDPEKFGKYIALSILCLSKISASETNTNITNNIFNSIFYTVYNMGIDDKIIKTIPKEIYDYIKNM